jgi:hypothetical protein
MQEYFARCYRLAFAAEKIECGTLRRIDNFLKIQLISGEYGPTPASGET